MWLNGSHYLLKSSWAVIGRKYVVNWVAILVSGTYYHYHYHYIVLVLLLIG
jgi:hypothetical protein